MDSSRALIAVTLICAFGIVAGNNALADDNASVDRVQRLSKMSSIEKERLRQQQETIFKAAEQATGSTSTNGRRNRK